MDREKLKGILQENEYGNFPAPATRVWAEELPASDADKMFCAGKAPLQKYLLKADVYGQTVVFPVALCIPKKVEKPVRTAVCLGFERQIPNKYFPAEEIIDRAWAFAYVCYEDVTVDSAEKDENAKILSSRFYTGKLAMWAWAAMRVMDYLQTRTDIDGENVAILGHSRLGKVALLTAAFDERFAYVHSNESGIGGAALYSSVGSHCENIEVLATVRPYWFSKKYPSFIGKEQSLPFDQDDLLGLIAPRVLSVGSAAGDPNASPQGEFACAKRASAAWKAQGLAGLLAPERAQVGERYHDGRVGYYLRDGCHYFSRMDWNNALSFFESKEK